MTERDLPDAPDVPDSTPPPDPKAELAAMATVLDAVNGLSKPAAVRVLGWVAESLGFVSGVSAATTPKKPPRLTPADSTSTDSNVDGAAAMGHEDVASFVDSSGAKSGPERALTVAYWFQAVNGQESWTGAALNAELKHQGHQLANVTATLRGLMTRKPAFVVQLRKVGTSRQARKLYKVTTAGINEVKAMFSRATAE